MSYKNIITNTLQVTLILSTKLGTVTYFDFVHISKNIIFLLWKMILMKRDCVVQGTNLGILVYKIMNVSSFQEKKSVLIRSSSTGF